MKLPPTGRVPPSDGVSHWRLPVGNGVIIRAKGHEELIKLVFEYRLRNNIEIGDVEREVSDYYCNQYPNFCHKEAHDSNPGVPLQSGESMLTRVSRWASTVAHRMPRGGYPLEILSTVEARAASCAACPFNVAWRGGCGGCSAVTLQLLQAVKSMRKTNKDGNLNGCSIGGWENSSAIHLPSACTSISDAQRSTMPAGCWRKQIP